MPAIKFPTKQLISFILLLFANVFYCAAQKVIHLKDVVRVELSLNYSVYSGLRVEVTRENGHWISSQTKKVNYKGIDSARKFIKNIPDTVLSQLLGIIARPDTGINMDLFNLQSAELINTIDGVSKGLKPAQKTEFASMLQSKPIVEKSLRKALKPLKLHDRTYYGISIITANGDKYTIHALTYAGLYSLPWHIGGVDCYNPAISTAFAFITGEDSYVIAERNRVLHRVTNYIYHENFRTRFNWDNFKTDRPASFAAFKNTLSPVNFYYADNSASIKLKSSRLPSYVRFSTFFKADDVAAASRYKRYEDTLVKFFDKKNFLFSYLKTQPGIYVDVEPDQINESGYGVIRDVKKYYPAIGAYKAKDILMFIAGAANHNRSVWLVTPDNKSILIQYKNVTSPDGPFKLLNLSSDELKGVNKHVCVVFDANGKVISNYGAAQIFFWAVQF